MRGLAWVALALACAGCSADVREGNANAVINEAAPVENAAEPSPTPLPPPPENLITPPDDNTIDATAGANGLPADVQRFVEQREGCEHWAGEPDFDEARRKQIEEAVRELCPGVDTQLAKLRKTYADNPRVMAALADFEPLGMDE